MQLTFYTSDISETVPNLLIERHILLPTTADVLNGHTNASFPGLPSPQEAQKLGPSSPLLLHAPAPSIPTVGSEFLSRRVCAFLISLLQLNAFCRSMSEHVATGVQGLAMKLFSPFKEGSGRMFHDILSLPLGVQRKTSASLNLQHEPFPVICAGRPASLGVPVTHSSTCGRRPASPPPLPSLLGGSRGQNCFGNRRGSDLVLLICTGELQPQPNPPGPTGNDSLDSPLPSRGSPHLPGSDFLYSALDACPEGL